MRKADVLARRARVQKLVAEGLSRRQIAERLGMTLGAVDSLCQSQRIKGNGHVGDDSGVAA